MAKLTTIDEIPVFSTPREAKDWGLQYGLRSYHVHWVEDTKGYMSGSTHNHVKKVVSGEVVPVTNYSVGVAASPSSNGGGGSMGGGSTGGY